MNLLIILIAVIAIQSVCLGVAALLAARTPTAPPAPSADGADDRVYTPGGPRRRDQVHEVAPDQPVEHGVVNHALRNRRPVSARELERALPPDFVITPGGPRHRSRVHQVENHEAVVSGPAGLHILDTHTGTARGLPAPEDAANVFSETGTAWIAYAGWSNGSGSSITSFSTTWTVPPPPSQTDNQLIFLFNGIENFGANFGILQPVLQWGWSEAGGEAAWMVASWYVTHDGTALHSPLVPVKPGDTLTGVMTLAGVNRTPGAQTSFDYHCVFDGLPATALNVRNINELYWCNQVLEAYRLTGCADYPNTASTAMKSIEIRTGAVNPTVLWSPVNAVTDCGQHVVVVSNSSTAGEVDLFYR